MSKAHKNESNWTVMDQSKQSFGYKRLKVERFGSNLDQFAPSAPNVPFSCDDFYRTIA